MRRRLRFRLRLRFEIELEAEGRVGEGSDSWSKDAIRRLLDCEFLRGTIVGIEMVRVWIGRKGLRSLRGEKEGLVGGAMDVGVVEARGEMGAEEKWSDGEAGSKSSCSGGGERMLREEMCEAKEECILSCGGSRRSSYSQQGS